MKLLAKFIKNFICIYLGSLFVYYVFADFYTQMKISYMKSWEVSLYITIGYIITEYILSIPFRIIKKH